VCEEVRSKQRADGVRLCGPAARDRLSHEYKHSSQISRVGGPVWHSPPRPAPLALWSDQKTTKLWLWLNRPEGKNTDVSPRHDTLTLFTDIRSSPIVQPSFQTVRFRVCVCVWGGDWVCRLQLQQYEGTVLFCPEPGKHSDFRLPTQRKAVNVSPSIKHGNPSKSHSSALCLRSRDPAQCSTHVDGSCV